MCGIVGYISIDDDAIKESMKVLKKLEYRGYDSAGIAFLNNKNDIVIKKSKGKIMELEKKIDYKVSSTCAIAHTRWATHGEPNENNAHPHMGKKTILVQNGIIENYNELKQKLINEKIDFYSETDTEVITKLIDYEYETTNDPIKAIRYATKQVKGSYALVLMFKDIPNTLYATTKDAPLVIMKKKEGFVLSSDVNSIGDGKKHFWFLNDRELAVINNKNVDFFNIDGEKITKKSKRLNISAKNGSKNGFPTYMLKEMNEQTNLLITSLKKHINDKNDISFNVDNIKVKDLLKYKQIKIIGCGSAYNTGLNAKVFFEDYSDIKCDVYIASEFRYAKFFNEQDTLYILISQSGETADTIACLRLLKQHKQKVLAITNNKTSTIANESDYLIDMNCGVEYAVASTKSYTIATFLLNLLALKIGLLNNAIDLKPIDIINQAFSSIYKAHEIFDNFNIESFAKEFIKYKNIFFIGRGFNYFICQEAALKLKELSYLNSNAYPAGELKHGTISLIDEESLVFTIVSKVSSLDEKTFSNMKEVIARKGKIAAICNDSVKPYLEDSDYFINNYADESIFSYLTTIYIVQLIAYYVSVTLGNDVDNPRNLAKSATVE